MRSRIEAFARVLTLRLRMPELFHADITEALLEVIDIWRSGVRLAREGCEFGRRRAGLRVADFVLASALASALRTSNGTV